MFQIPKRQFTTTCILALVLCYSFIVEAIVNNSSNIIEMISCGMLMLIIPAFVCMIVMSYNQEKRIGFLTFFLLLAFLFYYGQYFLVMIGYYDDLRKLYVSLVCGKIGEQYIINGLFLHVRALLVFFIGYNLTTKEQTGVGNEAKTLNRDSIYIPTGFHTVALLIFIISFVCSLVQLGFQLTLGTYVDMRSVSDEIFRLSSGSVLFYFAYFGKWFLPSSYMLLLFYAIEGKKERYRLVIIILGVYSLLYLRTGARFTVLKILTAVFIIHNYFVRPFTKKDLKWIIPISLVGILTLSSLSTLRTSSITVTGIADFFKGLSPDLALFNVLTETGTTSVCLANTLQNCPSTVEHLYFGGLLKSIFIILPSFLNPMKELTSTTTSSIFSPLLYGFKGTGYGSSFIAEAYYYWGEFMWIAIFVYGIITAKLNNSFRSINSFKNIGKIYLAVYMMSEMIYCVRNDVYDILRGVIYYVLIVLLVIRAIDRSPKKKWQF